MLTAALLVISGRQLETWKIAMSYKRSSRRKVSIWILVAVIAVAATQVYYVRELLAALIIFSVLFALVAAIVLALFLLDRASQLALGWIEVRAKSFAHGALRLLPARSARADETTAFVGNANRGHNKENQADDRANGALLEKLLSLSIQEHDKGCE